MSKQEELARGQGKGRKQPAKAPKSSLVTFRPTKEQKEALGTFLDSEGDLLSGLERAVQNNAKITLGYDGDRDHFWGILRDNEGPWNEAPAVAVHHSSMGKVLRGLVFYVTDVCPDFPDGTPAYVQTEFDW